MPIDDYAESFRLYNTGKTWKADLEKVRHANLFIVYKILPEYYKSQMAQVAPVSKMVTARMISKTETYQCWARWLM